MVVHNGRWRKQGWPRIEWQRRHDPLAAERTIATDDGGVGCDDAERRRVDHDRRSRAWVSKMLHDTTAGASTGDGD